MESGKSQEVTWITGGGSGIGRALAIEMAHRGQIVVVSGRRQNRLDEVVTLLKEQGYEALAIPCDVSQPEATKVAAKEIVRRFGRLDTCVANAGFSVKGAFETLSPKEWRRQMDVNLFGVIWTLQAALPYIKSTKGRLVVISSVAGKFATPKHSAYCSSKFALVGLCDTLYMELKTQGVSVSNILPGLVESEIAWVGNDGQFKPTPSKRPNYLVWPAKRAAKSIAKAIFKRKRQAIITGHGKLAVFLARYLPGLTYWLMSQNLKKLQES